MERRPQSYKGDQTNCVFVRWSFAADKEHNEKRQQALPSVQATNHTERCLLDAGGRKKGRQLQKQLTQQRENNQALVQNAIDGGKPNLHSRLLQQGRQEAVGEVPAAGDRLPAIVAGRQKIRRQKMQLPSDAERRGAKEGQSSDAEAARQEPDCDDTVAGKANDERFRFDDLVLLRLHFRLLLQFFQLQLQQRLVGGKEGFVL